MWMGRTLKKSSNTSKKNPKNTLKRFSSLLNVRVGYLWVQSLPEWAWVLVNVLKRQSANLEDRCHQLSSHAALLGNVLATYTFVRQQQFELLAITTPLWQDVPGLQTRSFMHTDILHFLNPVIYIHVHQPPYLAHTHKTNITYLSIHFFYNTQLPQPPFFHSNRPIAHILQTPS